jgi:hypothetical protein
MHDSIDVRTFAGTQHVLRGKVAVPIGSPH